MITIREISIKQDLEIATSLLAEAFYNDPLFDMVFNKKDRLRKSNYFFRFLITNRIILNSEVLLVLHNEEIAGTCSFSTPHKTNIIPFNLVFIFSTLKLIFKLGWRSFHVLNNYFKIVSKTKLKDTYYINFIAISRKYREKGFAKHLLDHIHKIVKSANSHIGLDTENPANIPYYERFGYQFISEQKLQNISIYSLLNKF